MRPSRSGAKAVAAGSFALLSGLCAYLAYFPMHNQDQYYDDEGYWLISLRSYHLHGSLYHDTFAQVGPLYYEFWSLIYSITRLPIVPDTGRACTLAVWVLTSLVFGISVYWLTHRVLLGLLAQGLSFVLLLSLVKEPMEPAGLAHLFVAFAVLGVAVAFRGRWRLGMSIIGLFTMAAVLTKINVGLFFAGGVVYALIVCWPSDRYIVWRRVVGGMALLAVPVLLMAQIVGRHWVQRYLFIELFALVGLLTVIGLRRRPAQPVRIDGVRWCVGAGAATFIVVTVGVLINGTSLGEFVSGALLSQRGLARVATIPLPSTHADVLVAGLCAVLAVVVVRSGYIPGAVVRIAVGCVLAVAVVGEIPNSPLVPPFQYQDLTLPLAWIALVPRSRTDDVLSFERVAICTAGVLGFLEAFPGAGSQLTWACLLLVPVSMLCISDGLEMMTTSLGHRTSNAVRRHAASFAVAVAALVVLVPVALPQGRAFLQERTLYYDQPRLGLPGGESLRLPSAQIVNYRDVTSALKAHCSAFESIPGVNSFYFFSEQDPPTDFNTTQWWKLLTSQQEEAAVTRLERARRPCVLVSPNIIQLWDRTGRDADLNRSPLMRYTHTHLELLDVFVKYGQYELYGKARPAPADGRT